MLDGRAERCALSVCGSERVLRGEDSSDCHTVVDVVYATRIHVHVVVVSVHSISSNSDSCDVCPGSWMHRAC
eukprot:2273975-Prymnesium_polylepis.1